MAMSYGNAASYSAEFAGPYAGGSGVAKITTITLPLSEWKGANSPYSQVITVPGISVRSKVDLQASEEQIAQLYKTRTVIYIENDEGTATAYAIGDKPVTDLTFQASVTEAVNV